jgi:site-specific DNA recombinase
MKTIALYVRVSSDHQAQQATIESQISALRERAVADGNHVLPGDLYVDNGFSGATLIRPALERLRDRVAEGAIDTLYVHHPDRLARNYASQMVLLDEFARHGVAVVFLQGPSVNNAEDNLLVQVQGMLAEYEREKILERSRRGKVHRARQGEVSPLSGAPYGYQYVRKSETGPARYHVLLHEAKIVRRIFDELVREQKSIREIVRGLNADHIPTPGSASRWARSTVSGILRNPAYAGQAAYGRSESVERHPQLRPPRNGSPAPRRIKSSVRDKPPEQWIHIPVPAIISDDIFAAARDQLQRNRRLSQRHARGERYLLQGLVGCAHCGYGFYGVTVCNAARKAPPVHGARRYSYYRCTGSDAFRFGGASVCTNPGLRAETLDDYVWESVQQVMQDPQRVLEEWKRRTSTDDTPSEQRLQRDDAAAAVARHERSLKRLLDAYEAGAIELDELSLRSERIKAQLQPARRALVEAEERLAEAVTLCAVAGRVQDFAERVKRGLAQLNWQQRRQLIRTLVARIEIGKEDVNVVYRLPPTGCSGGPKPEPSSAGARSFLRLSPGRRLATS